MNLHERAEKLAPAIYRRHFIVPPKRASTMTSRGAHKYTDLPGHVFSVEDVLSHLTGHRTWATTLAAPSGTTRSGCRDYDLGGKPILVDSLAAAQECGLTAFAIHMPGEGTDDDHDGGHVWIYYRRDVPVVDVRAQLANLPGNKGEIYPSPNPRKGNTVRLPFGRHRRKKRRGILILQDGREFNLDQDDELIAGIQAVLALRPNSDPPEAKAETQRSNDAAFGESYNPAHFEVLPDGAALWASWRYANVLCKFIPQLTQIRQGERVVLKRDGRDDDTNSAQVAALIANLITSHRKNQPLGDGAPPEAEIRAVALFLKPQLRPDTDIEHYRAQIDYEINRYRPNTYRPEQTIQIGNPAAATIQAVEASITKRKRGRPTGVSNSRLVRLDTLTTLLTEGQEARRRDLADATGVSERQISDDLRTLEAMGRIKTKPIARGFLVLSLEEKIPRGETNEPCNYATYTAVQSDAFCLGETLPGGFAPGAAVAADDSSSSDVSSVANIDQDQPSPAPTEKGRTAPRSVSPCSAAVTEADILRAVEAIPAQYQWVDRRTGEIKLGNVTLPRLYAHLGVTDPQQQRIVERVYRRMRKMQNPAYAATVEAPALSREELERRAKSSGSAVASGEKRLLDNRFDTEAARKLFASRMPLKRSIAGIYASEVARRDRLEEVRTEAVYEALDLHTAMPQMQPIKIDIEQPQVEQLGLDAAPVYIVLDAVGLPDRLRALLSQKLKEPSQ